MNVLIKFGSGAEDFDDEVYTELLDLLTIDKCVLIYNNKAELPSRKINKYVSQAFNAPLLLHGDYRDAIKQVGEGNPLDDELLQKMSPYENEVITMLLRWSQGDYVDIWHDYCNHVRFWNHVLDDYEIDAYFATEIPHAGYDYIIYLLCKIKGINFFSTQKISFPERLHIAVDIHDQLPFFKKEFDETYKLYYDKDIKEIKLDNAMQEMYDFYTGDNDRTPWYMHSRSYPRNRGWAIWLYKNIPITRWLFELYVGTNFCGRRTRELCRRLKFILNLASRICSFNIKVNNFFIKYGATTSVFREGETCISYYKTKALNADYNNRYVYVPLHFQPEQTTSPLGGNFVDQLLMIKMLSFYLPKGWCLFVKEHPSFEKYMNVHRATWRTKQFYDELQNIPNVKMIDLDEDTFKLINNSEAVAIITGTAGLEAITVCKPCLMFGYSYLQYAPNVITVRNNTDCKAAMEQLEKGFDNSDIVKKIKIYFKVLEKYIFVGNILWYDAAYRSSYLNDREKSKKNIISAYIKAIKKTCKDNYFKTQN